MSVQLFKNIHHIIFFVLNEHFGFFFFFFFFFKQKTAYEIGLGIPAEPLFRSSITTILKRRGCLTVPRLTLMSLIKMMLVMVSVAAISKTFGLLRFLLRLSFLAK